MVCRRWISRLYLAQYPYARPGIGCLQEKYLSAVFRVNHCSGLNFMSCPLPAKQASSMFGTRQRKLVWSLRIMLPCESLGCAEIFCLNREQRSVIVMELVCPSSVEYFTPVAVMNTFPLFTKIKQVLEPQEVYYSVVWLNTWQRCSPLVHSPRAVSYTHLTLPTNREV